ncbi:hypothetical protein [Sphingomonas lenta]|uniref:Secreted protein n=1 Tax=Sphingomonas lenta TaxID=1141887 RepID=A0A2A2SD98_9SPHN|nr:hypothetical protein [Sphingomonas lenta]PAX07264.1 hypothetical protein CKY28_14675 [Sphingomonas lenta]
MFRSSPCCVLLLLLLPATASAQREGSGARLLDDLARCRAVPGAPERLACFERLADGVAVAKVRDEVLVVDRERLAAEQRRRFGLPGSADNALAAATGGRAPEVRELTSTVRTVEPARDHGRWNLQLADGTSWQSVEPSSFDPRAGKSITIRTAALGGYRAQVEGGRSFLVKRLR